MRFEFATAQRIVCGPGTAAEVPSAARGLGRHVLLVCGRDALRSERLADGLRAEGLAVTRLAIAQEPSIVEVEAGTRLAKEAVCDVVVGFGGGSVIDAAKAVAVLLANPGELLDYLEVIGRGRPLTASGVPCIAIPTTAGTGAEVTRNAVLASPAHRVKVSLRSPLMLPRLAIVDPELTYGLPPNLTATTGLDALTQLIEPYVSCRANPMTDALCVEGMRRAARSLRRAVEDGGDKAAREDMAIASLFGGMALANAGLGAVHGFAGPIGGAFPAPHGAICAALLPSVTAVNLRALRQRVPENPALRRYAEIARLLTGNPQAEADDAVSSLLATIRALSIPGLATYGVGERDFSALAEAAGKASSMKGNPLPLTPGESREILTAAL